MKSPIGLVSLAGAYPRSGKAGDLDIDVAVYPDVLVDREYIKANASRDYDNQVLKVCFGSLADMAPQFVYVPSTPKSGHPERRSPRPLSANSGHLAFWEGRCPLSD